MPTHTVNQEAIDQFCDACWLEDGLSKNSLSAYRRDLTLFANWLELDSECTKSIYQVVEADLTAYMASKRDDKASTANRRLTVFKRFYRYALRQHLVEQDPCLKLRAAKQAQRLEGRLIALGVNVVLTRSANNSPLEIDRIKVANSVNADLVIALKVDSYKNENANGVATYFYGRDDKGVRSVVGERFANLIQREICARTDLLNCQTHAKSWDLLRLTIAPTVRIDLGYLSSPYDAKRLATAAFRDQLAEAMIVAIQRLYLSAEDDAKTGTLKISDLRRAGLRN